MAFFANPMTLANPYRAMFSAGPLLLQYLTTVAAVFSEWTKPDLWWTVSVDCGHLVTDWSVANRSTLKLKKKQIKTKNTKQKRLHH